MSQLRCPECSTEYVKRVAGESLQERLLNSVYFYPFRCQLCGHRFKSLQWGMKYLTVEDDRRSYERLASNFPVTFTSGAVQIRGTMADLSIAGCAIRAAAKFAPGTILRISLQTSEDMPTIVVEAAVARDVSQNYVRLEFLHLTKSQNDLLHNFIADLSLQQKNSPASESHLSLTAQTVDHR